LNEDPACFLQSYDAAMKLGDFADPDHLEAVASALIKALAHPNPLTKAHSAESLGKMRYRYAAPALTSMLNDPYRLIRSYSARSLGQIGDERAIDALVSSLKNDEFFGVRAEAAEALGQICRKSSSVKCGQIPRILIDQIKIEEGRGDERRRRVLAELALALTRNRIGSVLGTELNALEEGKPLELDTKSIERFERGMKDMKQKLQEAGRTIKQEEDKAQGGFKNIWRGLRESLAELASFGERIDKMKEKKERVQFVVSTSKLLVSVMALLIAPPIGGVALAFSLADIVARM